MAEENERPAPQTTVVVQRGGFGTILIGLALLVAVMIGAWFLLSEKHSDLRKNDAIATAADKIGDSADKVGDSAEKAANKIAP
jgi:hypothetical protein